MPSAWPAACRPWAIRDQCQKAGVAFHFKQWGGVFKKRNGRLLEGRTWDEMPSIPAVAAAELPPLHQSAKCAARALHKNLPAELDALQAARLGQAFKGNL
jgi:hypothetical protein